MWKYRGLNMRILIAMILTLTCLFGCASGNDGVADGLKLREQMTKGNGCSFVAGKFRIRYLSNLYRFERLFKSLF